MAIGKAGNPDIQSNVDIVIGPGTEAIAGEGKIITAGGIDPHIHFICPQQIEEALCSGVTTMMGGGTGPATGTNATTCTPGPWHISRMLQAAEGFAMNLGFFGKGNASPPHALVEQVRAGVDFGTGTPIRFCVFGCRIEYRVVRERDLFPAHYPPYSQTVRRRRTSDSTISSLSPANTTEPRSMTA